MANLPERSTPIADAEALPLRDLTPDADAALRRFFTPGGGAGFFLASFLPLTIGLSVANIFLDDTVLAFAVSIGLSLLVLLLRWSLRRARLARARFVYQYGGEETLVLSGASNNWGFKVNGAPQQVLTLTRNGKPMQVRTFNPTVLAAYSVPQQQAYTHPKYPAVVIPEGLFRLQWTAPSPAGVGRTIGRWALRLLPFAFVVGLWAVIDGAMGSASHSDLQPDAVFYQGDGGPVVAGVLNRFKAYEVSNKGTYGTSSCFAVCYDLRSGKQRWKTALAGKDKKGNTIGGARLLGQSPKYLFYLRNELLVLDKATGKIVARNGDFSIGEAMPRPTVADYMDDAGYTYNDSLGGVLVQGNDGLYYAIDGTTLQAAPVAAPAAGDDAFKNHFRFGNNYDDQIADLYDDGQRCLALLDAEDTALLAHDGEAFASRSAAQSVRRMLVAASSDNADDGWQVLNPSLFLTGGFLVGTAPAPQPHDSVSKYASYQALWGRYNNQLAPLRTGDGSLLILHKSSIERDATLLLTAVSPEGRVRWQVQTGYGSLPLQYPDAAGNALYLWGDPDGGISDNLRQYLRIDLATGAVTKRDVE